MINLSDVQSLLTAGGPYVALSFAALFILTLVGFLLALRLAKQARVSRDRAKWLIRRIEPTTGIEKNAEILLECVSQLLDADVYAFYVFDNKNKHYLLKAVRHSGTDFGRIRPSYSGLSPYKKEAYLPPLSIPVTSLPSTAGIVNEGEVPLYIAPLGNCGLFRIGPVQKLSRKSKRALTELANHIQYLLPNLLKVEEMRSQVDVVVASGRALQNISKLAIDPKVMIERLLDASMHALGAYQVVLLQHNVDRVQVEMCIGGDQEILAQLNDDASTIQWLSELASQSHNGVSTLQAGSPEFYRIPPYLASTGLQALAALRLVGRGAVIYMQQQIHPDQDVLLRQIGLIAQNLNGIIEAQAPLKSLSKVYIQILKQLATTIDNLNPFTVGYSEMMSRYSIAIGKQLGMPDDEIRDVALAAYLSNIGVLGLSDDFYQKEGKFTEAEFELMKLHAEVGASMVSVTTGNKRVASYIMYHHERMDGAGYPAGIRGTDIPLGARIISVVQTFLAKINGRKGRDPIPFDQALAMLQASAGTQLDKQVVQTFIDWFSKKQAHMKGTDRSLGSCWEMCCTPSIICEHCPVYQQNGTPLMNCWEIEGNLCRSHGKSCSSCFVHTEFMARSAVKLHK